MTKSPTKKRSSPSPETRRRWKHNSFLGYASAAQKQMTTILDSDSATPEAKAIADEIYKASRRLAEALRFRLDDGKLILPKELRDE